MPYPFSRNTCPFCVSGGMRSRAGLPDSVCTSASPPSTAVVTGTGTLDVEVATLQLEHRMRREPHAQVQMPRLGAADALLAFTADPHARAVDHAGGNPHVDGPALPVVRQREPLRRAVIGVFERQLDLVLDVAARAAVGRGRARAPAAAPPPPRRRRRRTW